MWRFAVVATVAFLFLPHASLARQDQIALEQNVYSDVLIAIKPEVPESPQLIEKIKETFTAASSVLYRSTKQRAIFGKINILVPATWTNGNYTPTTTLNYEQSDFRIAPSSGGRKDEPFTEQRGNCGEFGEYMQITPRFLTNDSLIEDFGTREKVIVHEWAHLRWGVFDEYATGNRDRFYVDDQNVVQATRCPLSLRGQNLELNVTTKEVRACQLDPDSGIPSSENCRFFPGGSPGSVSMMSHLYLDNVVHFCHDDPTEPDNMHNSFAPNRHNAMCGSRSTWAVITESPDFANGANQPNGTIGTIKPTFTVVQPQAFRKFALVLDVSGSMSGTRLIQMRQAVKAFIEQAIPVGDKVSVITFSIFAFVGSSLVDINNDQDKQSIIDILPTFAFGGTCIGCGMRSGIQTLTGKNGMEPCGEVIIFTDGEENEKPFINDIRPLAIERKCTMHAVFFTTSANEDLRQLTVDTNGKWFFGLDDDLQALIGAFSKIAEKNDGSNQVGAKTIHRENLKLTAYQKESRKVSIDNTVGKETIFQFFWQGNLQPEVVLTTPTGCTYSSDAVKTVQSCVDQPISVIAQNLKSITFKVPGLAENGLWSYSVTSVEDQTVTPQVTSKPSGNDVKPIKTVSKMSPTKKRGQVILRTTVTRDGAAVLNLQVEATVKSPKSGQQFKIKLEDNGIDPDQTKDDGTYSKYFLGKEPGRYSMEVQVTHTAGSETSKAEVEVSRAPFKFGEITKDGLVHLNPNGEENRPEPVQAANVSDIGNFSRIDTAEGLEIPVPDDPQELTRDNFAPRRVNDLSVRQRNITDVNSGVVIEFTAPGDDADSGNATRYEICYTFGSGLNLTRNFLNNTCPQMFVIGDLSNPQESGSREFFVMPTPDFDVTVGTVRIAFAVRAVDEAGNVGETSNIGFVSYFLEPPTVIQPPTETIPVLTTTTSTSTLDATTTTNVASVTATKQVKTASVLPGENYCMTCYQAKSHEECAKNSVMVLCKPNQESCATEIRTHYFGAFKLISKYCKQKMACHNNMQQNAQQCNRKLSHSVCRCCCESNRCNMDSSSCNPDNLQ